MAKDGRTDGTNEEGGRSGGGQLASTGSSGEVLRGSGGTGQADQRSSHVTSGAGVKDVRIVNRQAQHADGSRENHDQERLRKQGRWESYMPGEGEYGSTTASGSRRAHGARGADPKRAWGMGCHTRWGRITTSDRGTSRQLCMEGGCADGHGLPRLIAGKVDGCGALGHVWRRPLPDGWWPCIDHSRNSQSLGLPRVVPRQC
uniref:Uncharacterized protein n=1 Tax=Knipowitschia caucasica TaxID=637954 RepID=A0AAV2KI90_KNICA